MKNKDHVTEVKFAVFDFDGVFSDGNVCINNNGDVLKKYNSKDGMGIGLLKKNNIKVGVISGYKENDSQKEILKHLKIEYVALNIKNKLEKLQEWCEELNIDLKTEVAYMGDDLNDMQVINEVNLSGCPFDAIDEIKQIVKFNSKKKGGEGCVREFCDFILNKLENKLGYFDKVELNINNTNKEDFSSGFELLDSSYNTKVNNIKDINVIILASDSNDRCLSKCKGNTFLLEQQIRLCLISGIQKKNIHVIFDSNKISKMREFFKDIGCNYYSLNNNINYRSCIPLIETVSKINDVNNFNYIVIQSNVLFTVSQLEIIYNNLDRNILLSREAISTTEKGVFLDVNNTNINGVISEQENNDLLFPWKIFAGIMCIKYEIIKEIKNNSKTNNFTNLSLPEYVHLIACKLNIELTNIDFYPTTSMDNKGNCMELKGGSYANLSKNLIVRKTASGKGYEKLEYELKFLKNNITSDIVEYFPKILNEYKDDKIIFFDMPFYNFECLQRLILLKSIKYEDVIKLLEKIFDFIFNKLYTKILGNDVDDWVMNKHIQRVLIRLEETSNYSKKYEEFINADTITINGKKYENIKFIINKIMNNKTFLEKLKPDYMRLIHGDLHFENIMVFKENNEYNFKLIDPRGELTGSDFYYDMGKLWHSFNSLYDFVRTDQFSCDYSVSEDKKNIDVKLEIGDKSMLEMYNKIKDGSLQLFKKYDLVNKDPLFEMKSRFSEAMHLSSVYPFHLYKDTRATVLYFRSVVVLNEFFEDYKDMIC